MEPSMHATNGIERPRFWRSLWGNQPNERRCWHSDAAHVLKTFVVMWDFQENGGEEGIRTLETVTRLRP
jgi:hypothetical protein